MAISEPVEFSTRAAFRADLERNLRALTTDARKEVAGGEWDGVPVVTIKDLDEAFAAVFDAPLPPPSSLRAEVRTPASVVVSAECPKCHLSAVIPVTIGAVLVVDGDGAELKLKAKAKARTHVCGQLGLDDVAGEQGSFELDDIVGAARDAVADAEQADDEAGDEITAATEACPFPGCVRQVDHKGKHDVRPTEDDGEGALLPA